MRNLRENTAAKALAVLLCVILSASGFWASMITVSRWDELWSGGDFYESGMLEGRTNYDTEQAFELAKLYQAERWDGALDYGDAQRRQALEQALGAQQTNFRFQVHDRQGNRLCGNAADGALEASVHRVYMTESVVRRMSSGQILSYNSGSSYRFYVEDGGDSQAFDAARGIYLLSVAVDGAYLVFTPEEQARALQYGWSYDGDEWSYDVDRDGRVKSAVLYLEYGLASPLQVEDDYTQLRADFVNFQDSLPLVAVLALVLDLAVAAALIFLFRAAGHRAGGGAVRPNWQDRIPYDLYLLLAAGAYTLLICSGDAITYSFNGGATAENIAGLAVISLGVAGVTVAVLLSTVTRIKLRLLLRNTLVWSLCRWMGRSLRACGRWVGRLGRDWPIVWRVGGAFLAYLLISIVSAPTVIFFLLWQGLALWALLRWIKQWQAVREGTVRIVGGEPDFVIDTGKMFPDLRVHAEQLNDLGSAIGTAVEERLKSERFKTELITNVSHDLKTPLTSIINYVDLLKKEEIENPRAQEYLEVLERKSQRLKKLTEDLVEASKASTGSLTVVRSRLGVCQLVEQAAAEYQEKLEEKGLTLISTLPAQELYVEADGRHVWRIIDNLLGNCYKYALEGTRIYLNAALWDGTVTLSLKNISRQQLNIPPEQLMERFVRGEESRSTEGSGLGLSIARSLTELQGGAFRLDIDGDLFKATVAFPEAPPAALPGGEGETQGME